jgi:homoserine O-acetyltransferase
MAEIKKISISDFRTHSGAVFTSIKLYYQQFGKKIGTAPVVLVNHSLTGDSQLIGDGGWWNEIIGPYKTIDTNRYTVLGFNIPGNGVMDQTFSIPENFHAGDIASIFLKRVRCPENQISSYPYRRIYRWGYCLGDDSNCSKIVSIFSTNSC